MVELPETKPTNLPLPVISRLFKEGVVKIEEGDLGLSEDPRDRIAIVRAIYPILKRKVKKSNMREGTKLGPIGPAPLNLEREIVEDTRKEIGFIIGDKDENRKTPGHSRTGAFNLKTGELRIELDDRIVKL